MKELVLGGARSGKSAFAQRIAESSGKELIYIATATAGDAEMAARIARHQAERSTSWRLIEEPLELARVLQENAADDRCILVDCLTLWLTNLLLAEVNVFQVQRQALLDTLPDLPGDIIFVSNEVGMGIVPLGELSRRFCDEAGWLNQALAQLCDRVTFTAAGLPMVLKGEKF